MLEQETTSMKKTLRVIPLLALASLFTAACGSSAESGASSGSAAVAPAEKGDKKTCADFGGSGEGTFNSQCYVPAPTPFNAKWTGNFEKNTSNEEVATIEVTSKADRTVTWGTVSVWCYDGSGKQLELTPLVGKSKFKRYMRKGSGIFRTVKPGKDKLAPGDTMVIEGPNRAMLPEGLDSCAVEVTSWGWEEGAKLFLSVDRPNVPNMDIRPKEGFK